MYADPLIEAQETFHSLGWRYALATVREGKADLYTVWNADGELIAQDIPEAIFVGMAEQV